MQQQTLKDVLNERKVQVRGPYVKDDEILKLFQEQTVFAVTAVYPKEHQKHGPFYDVRLSINGKPAQRVIWSNPERDATMEALVIATQDGPVEGCQFYASVLDNGKLWVEIVPVE